MVLKKTLESPLDCKEIQPVRPKGDQSWVFIGSSREGEGASPSLGVGLFTRLDFEGQSHMKLVPSHPPEGVSTPDPADM